MDDFSDDGELQLDTHIHIHTANIHMPGFFQVRDNKDETYKTGQREECVQSSWVHSFRIKMELKKKEKKLRSGSERRPVHSVNTISSTDVPSPSPEVQKVLVNYIKQTGKHLFRLRDFDSSESKDIYQPQRLAIVFSLFRIVFISVCGQIFKY